MRLAVFTVCPNHRVPQARTLLDTVARFLPGATRFLVLADEPHPCVPYPAGCQVVPARELGVPDFPQFAFRYDPMEFAAALKPFAFRFLHATHACTHCLYFDPAVELFSSLPAVMEALAAHAPFVLTPQLLAPAEGEDGPNDLTFLREGAFNLGFLGVSFTPEAWDLLGWWARWLRRDCVNDRGVGFYVDQRFMDLMPGFASGVRILRDPGLNAGAWNLAQRRFEPDAPGGPQVEGGPLGFFNYGGSGSPASPAGPQSWPQSWPESWPDSWPDSWRTFLAAYAARLAAAGHGTIPPGCYAFGRFASGVPIPDIARRLFRDDHEAWAGDPFETYEAWCHLPARDAVTGLGSAVPSLVMRWLQARRPALVDMSMREQDGSERLVRWWLGHGRSEGIDRRFLQPLSLAAGRRPLRSRATRLRPSPDRADATVVASFAAADLGGRALADGLSRAGRVERLDVLAKGTQPASGRVLAVCMAPRQLRPFLHVLAPRLPSRAYRVFVPWDETADLAPPFGDALAGFDEVWAPTGFLQARLVLATGLPVLHMPVLHMPVLHMPVLHAGVLRGPVPGPASLASQPYVLVADDAFPGSGALLAAVRAFGAAFRGTPAAYRPRLVVPGGRAHAWDQALRGAVAEAGAVVADDTAALVAGAACVLALHRGEALGLSVVRALAQGVPVVATDEGGCTDLLTPRTGFPVEARPAPDAAGAAGPARVAADPCHAAWSLREVFERPDEARRRAAHGQQAVAESCDPARVASRQAARLAALGLLPARHMLDQAA